jgi:pimeloyl-ACP methyl ester carboxylesterase
MPLQALSDGTRLHYETAGDGVPTLVPCIASSVPYERSFGEELKKDFRFIFVEVRGTARSEGEKDVSSLDRISDDLEDLRQQLGLDRVIALAQSRNGLMAVHYAHKYPQSVIRTVTIGTPLSLSPQRVLVEDYWDAVADETRKRLRIENEAQMKREGVDRSTPAGIVRWFDLEGPRLWYDPTTTMTDWWEASLINPSVLEQTENGWAHFDMREALLDSNVPAFVTFGKYDFHVPPTPELLEGIPGVRVEVFDESGHFPYCEQEQEFVSRYRAWVKSLESEAVPAASGASLEDM